MMVSVQVAGQELQFMVDGGSEAQAVTLLEAASIAIRERLAATGQPAPPTIIPPPTPELYLPTGHGKLPPLKPGR